METIAQKNARLKKLRERRDGTPEQKRYAKKFYTQIRKAQHRAKQDLILREMARVLVRDVEQQTGTRAPETVQKFIRGED